MKRIAIKTVNEISLILLLALTIISCGDKKSKEKQFPSNFLEIGDAGRIAWMMNRVTPDSLARFIIKGALGQVPGARIDSLAIATNYAYERMKGPQLEAFSIEYDNIIASLPLADKMKVYMLGGSEDPQGLGYRLGLEYVTSIREDHKRIDDIEKELDIFRKACGNDTDTYRRFMIGFRTVLKVDSGKDLPSEVYNRFMNE